MRQALRNLWVYLLLVGLIGLGCGLRQGQQRSVRQWADTLCTSCIGLTDRGSH
ncbi:MAG: hypothetical protein N2512_04495 [Armatimonadetes bacterium]|nr:hypothetical protein [Armatimonadota bacterium]